jgi:hypothetical protein
VVDDVLWVRSADACIHSAVIQRQRGAWPCADVLGGGFVETHFAGMWVIAAGFEITNS